MDSNRHYRLNPSASQNSFDHFHPNPPPNHYEMGKPTYVERHEPVMSSDIPKTSGSFGSQASHVRTIDEAPTEAEINLIRKLRTLQGGDYEAQYFDNNPNPKKDLVSRMGNPTPLALAAFGMTNTMMSMFLMRIRGAEQLNFLVGTFWFVAGLLNILCAIFELLVGNTFAWTIFGSLGGYFMSLGALLTPAFGVTAAYASKEKIHEFYNAMGLFNACWAAMFLLFFVVSMKTNVFMIFIFGCVSVTCILSSAGDFYHAHGNLHMVHLLNRVAGVFLFASSIPNWYLLFLILATSAGWKIKLPTGDIGAAGHGHGHKAE